MMREFLRSRALSASSILVVLSVSGFADQVLFQRDLPGINLNVGAGASRTNFIGPDGVATIVNPSGNQSPFIIGDDFILPGSGGYMIQSITLYVVLGSPTDTFAQEISGLTLYGGPDNNGSSNLPLNILSSNFSSIQTHYTGTTDFESSTPGTFFPVYAVTFSNLNWSVLGGVNYDFALGGVLVGGNTLQLSASNMATSGGVQDTNLFGSDGHYLYFIGNNPPYNITPSNLPVNYASCDCSPPQDLNVVITGANLSISDVPEPSTIGLVGLGLGAALLHLRRRK